MRRLLRVLFLGLLMLLPMAAGAASPGPAWAAGWEQATGGKMVGAATAALRLKAGARVLDTRSMEAFEAGHLPGAVWMAPDRLLASQSGALVLVPTLEAPQGVLVVGKMGGEGWWGEQGWLGMVLASLGVAEVTVALAEPSEVALAAGVALERGLAVEPEWLRLASPSPLRSGVLSVAEAAAAQASGSALFLDVRSRAECSSVWRGAGWPHHRRPLGRLGGAAGRAWLAAGGGCVAQAGGGDRGRRNGPAGGLLHGRNPIGLCDLRPPRDGCRSAQLRGIDVGLERRPEPTDGGRSARGA